MSTPLNIREDIFQDLVSFSAQTFNLPPLSSKIYAYLVFDFDRNGISFDDLVEVFCASKSSISSNVNLLLSRKLIRDFSKINERKRLFVINEIFQRLRFEQIIDKLEREVQILDKLKDFHGKPDEKLEIYRELLANNITSIKQSLSKL